MKPCCPSAAERKVKKIVVGETVVGIVRWEEIKDEVRKKGGRNEEEIAEELLRLVKIYNYVPSSAEEEYKEALLREYKRWEHD